MKGHLPVIVKINTTHPNDHQASKTLELLKSRLGGKRAVLYAGADPVAWLSLQQLWTLHAELGYYLSGAEPDENDEGVPRIGVLEDE